MTSNIGNEAKPPAKDSPTEPFKRAVTGCLRAIARKPELEVVLRRRAPRHRRRQGAAARAAAQADRGRTPPSCAAMPTRSRSSSPATIPRCIARLVPGGQQARAVFDAVEQARVEAIGARRMTGVAKNLSAMLDDRFHRGKFDEITDRADAPIEEAVALMVRERLTGIEPAAGGRASSSSCGAR